MCERHRFSKKVCRALVDPVQVITGFIKPLFKYCFITKQTFDFYLMCEWQGNWKLNYASLVSVFSCNHFSYQVITAIIFSDSNCCHNDIDDERTVGDWKPLERILLGRVCSDKINRDSPFISTVFKPVVKKKKMLLLCPLESRRLSDKSGR